MTASAGRSRNVISGNRIIETGGQTCIGGISVSASYDSTRVLDNHVDFITPAVSNSGTNAIITQAGTNATKGLATAMAVALGYI